jgi:multiple sugar transport system permease protein
MKTSHPSASSSADGGWGHNSERHAVLGFLAPLVFIIATFVLLPVVGTLVDSLFLDVTYLDREFIAFDNFRWIFRDPGFWQALRFTALFVLVSVPLEVVFGLLIALLLNERVRFRGALRACVLVPWAIPAVVSGRIFELIYNYSFGAANVVLQYLHIVDAPVNWFGSSLSAFLALVAADVWKTTPFAAIILLAGLSGIPEEIYRQARIDRTTFVQRFFKITLPLLRPVLAITVVLRIIDALRIFDLIFVLTGGGPGGATMSVSLFSYDYFSGGDFGYGSAASVILFVFAFGLTVLVLKTGRFERGAA